MRIYSLRTLNDDVPVSTWRAHFCVMQVQRKADVLRSRFFLCFFKQIILVLHHIVFPQSHFAADLHLEILSLANGVDVLVRGDGIEMGTSNFFFESTVFNA